MEKNDYTGEPLPAVFNELGPLDKIGPRDYHFGLRGGGFDYVSGEWVGLPADPQDGFVFARAILSVSDMLDMLQANNCVCGKFKERMRSYCPECYRLLPRAVQGRLYDRVLHGYEHALLTSLIYLIGIGRTDAEKIRAAVPAPKGGK